MNMHDTHALRENKKSHLQTITADLFTCQDQLGLTDYERDFVNRVHSSFQKNLFDVEDNLSQKQKNFILSLEDKYL